MKHDAPAIIAMTNQRFKEFQMPKDKLSPAEEARVSAAIAMAKEQEDKPHGPDNPVPRDPPFKEPETIEEGVEAIRALVKDQTEVLNTPPLPDYDVVRPTKGSILMCARLVHAAIEALNSALNEYTVSWESNKASIIAGVKRTLANPHESPQANHEAWCKFRKSEGWVFGATKDEKAKTHPCLLPYDALGPFQQSKDLIFQALVRTFFGLDQALKEVTETTLDFAGVSAGGTDDE